MTTQLHLRPYQREAIDAVFKAWSSGMRRPAVVLPTGMGKTVVFSHLVSEFSAKTGQRVAILVHRDELADQAINKIKNVAPHLSIGKVKAESDEITADVLVCSVQTLAVERRFKALHASQKQWGKIGLLVTDECHHGAAATYQNIYDRFPDALNVGFTATLERGDGVGLGDTWDDVVASKSVLYAIKHKFLTDVRARAVEVGGLNLGSVKKSRGDFQSKDLGEALEASELSEVLPKAYKEHAVDRPGVVFTPTVATAQGVSDAFNASGIKTAVISGETPREERQRIYEDYRLGRIQVLSNCMVLTEGFDAPWASCAVIARPTQSRPLYIQMVGRVLRPWPGKKDALVLDVAGVGGKLATLIDLAPGQVESVEEGESLEEAVLREEENDAPERSRELKSIRLKEIDLFEASSQSWLLTEAGVMFIPVGDGEVFLWASQEPGAWDVCYAPKQGRWQRLRVGLPLGTAQAWAETEAEELMPFNTGRSASWRSKRPSDKLVRFAANLGIDSTGKRAGEVSNLVAVKLASWKYDRHLGM